MKRTDHAAKSTKTNTDSMVSVNGNGRISVGGEVPSVDLSVILSSLQTMRDGDFSVRLPGNWTGLGGKIADTFNDIVKANQQMAKELKRVGQVVGKEGRTRERMRFDLPKAAWGEMEERSPEPCLSSVLPCHCVQFWQTQNSWRLDRSCRGCRRRIIPRMVDATDLCPVIPACLNNEITISSFPSVPLVCHCYKC